MFIDRVDITVKGGRGGRGAISFERKKFQPFGGPDGGDGGHGGKVILKASGNLFDLSPMSHHPLFSAEDGQGGQGRKKAGRSGEDLLLEVPRGTLIIDKLKGEEIIDLVMDEQEIVVARGGKGGRGNVHFKSSANRAPRYAEWGEIGQSRELTLDFRLMLDAALLGPPNSGKSSLLNALTGARAEVASYQFTTTIPVLGVLRTDPPLTLGEIPALRDAEGGLRFWKHTERVRVLVMVVDLTIPHPGEEVETFFAGKLPDKPLLIVGNKRDLLSKPVKSLTKNKGIPTVQVSAVTGEGLKELEDKLLEMTARAMKVERKEAIGMIRFSAEAPVVRKINEGVFEIRSYEVERALSSINLDTPKGIKLLKEKVKELGLEKLLIKEGIQPYQQVKIGETWFTYVPEE